MFFAPMNVTNNNFARLLEDAEMFVCVFEVERRLFEVVVDNTGEVSKLMSVGCGRGDEQKTLSSCD